MDRLRQWQTPDFKLPTPYNTLDDHSPQQLDDTPTLLSNITRERGRDLTQSYEKKTYTNKNVKRAK